MMAYMSNHYPPFYRPSWDFPSPQTPPATPTTF
jgi:hypothetical protein